MIKIEFTKEEFLDLCSNPVFANALARNYADLPQTGVKETRGCLVERAVREEFGNNPSRVSTILRLRTLGEAWWHSKNILHSQLGDFVDMEFPTDAGGSLTLAAAKTMFDKIYGNKH